MLYGTSLEDHKRQRCARSNHQRCGVWKEQGSSGKIYILCDDRGRAVSFIPSAHLRSRPLSKPGDRENQMTRAGNSSSSIESLSTA